MTAKAMAWAWEQKVPPPQKLVLLALADGVSEHELADRCGLWPEQVKHELQRLRRSGLVAEVDSRRQS